MDSVAAVAVAQAESAIAGKRLLLIEQAKGCHESMAPFFCARPHCAMCHALGAVYRKELARHAPVPDTLLLPTCREVKN